MNPEIKIGSTCPDFRLTNQYGEEVQFSELLKKADHTTLIFYRGHW